MNPSEPEPETPRIASAVLADLWQLAGLPSVALASADLPGEGPVLPSSFAVATAAQASLAAAALAAGEIWHRRTGGDGRNGGGRDGGGRQRIRVATEHAALDSCGHFSLDGKRPNVWEKFSGLYPCGSAVQATGWVRIHANFAHHRDGALQLLGLAKGVETERDAVSHALQTWRAEDFEDAAAEAGLVVSAARDFANWDAHPAGQALAQSTRHGAAPVTITRIADGPTAAPLAWQPITHDARPLAGLRVLDLTRILAGPVAGRTLAAYGAEVMLVNSPKLPNIESIADTSRGKLSAHLDLCTEPGREALRALVGSSHVFVQGYRPCALAALGFGPGELARLRPGIVAVSLSAYGTSGPWAGRRGFDSLVQTATGFNLAEAAAFAEATNAAFGATQPKALPMQILDYAAGYLMAFGAQAALLRQAEQGGSWHVQVSLAGVGLWLRRLGRLPAAVNALAPSFEPYLEDSDSGFGRLRALRHAAEFSITPAAWARPSMPPGSHPPLWPT